MNKIDFQYIRDNGLLLFEYVRGSKLYHTDTTDSDTDTGGVFIQPIEFGISFPDEVKDDKGDTRWWELGKFMRLAQESEPGALELLFVPDDMVIYEHPLFKEIRKHRDEFVTKSCFKRFGSYAVSQIKKAQGQNKKIHWDMEDMKRKTPLDFCYTYDDNQGSVNIVDWLRSRGLRQDCCGLVNLPNMRDNYLLYYDFAQHLKLNGMSSDIDEVEKNDPNFYELYFEHSIKVLKKKYFGCIENISDETIQLHLSSRLKIPYGGHCGIINTDESSNTVRLCSTDKEEVPLCIMNYNQDAYGSHCRKYKEYTEWKEKRNKARYESNMEGEKSGDPDMKYDCKNMYHSFRNVAMCKEIAEGKGILLDRTDIDREFLMDVRARKFGYTELMARLKDLAEQMQKSIDASTIRDEVDMDMVETLTKKTREEFFKKQENDCFLFDIFGDGVKKKMCDDERLKALRNLCQRLGVDTDDVMITGSYALDRHGLLPDDREVHDLDIVIRGDDKLDERLKAVTSFLSGNTFFNEYEGNIEGIKHKPFIFKFEDVIFNIWVQDKDMDFDSNIMGEEGFYLATVKHIIDVKKKYGRPKDLKDIMDILKKII